ncbi:MAG: cyclase family protein [Povalibacter sp.]
MSIPLRFDAPQPTFFGAEPARATPLVAGDFIGDVKRGGSVNCSRYSLTPHCNGTHTECLGHVTHESVSVRSVAPRAPIVGVLLSVTPESYESTGERGGTTGRDGDRLITLESLRAAAARAHLPCSGGALIIRTLPNDASKCVRNYDAGPMPPYLSAEATEWMVSLKVEHLIVDLPSLDRAADQGQLTAHRIFWGMAAGSTDAHTATRAHATVTEFAFIDSSLADGLYLVNLQVAPFEADAAPSRPILYPLLRT